jgi:hypothetical protein
MPEKDAIGGLELLADEIWRQLEARGIVDAIGGAEYERRIVALRAWLWDADGLDTQGPA